MSPRSTHLDMLRGLAALLVVFGHVRGFVLVDYADIAARSSATAGAAAASSRRARALAIVAAPAALAAAIFARVRGVEAGLAEDVALGLCVALALPGLARAPLPRGRLYTAGAKALSNISYTLYATHFPALFALWAMLIAPRQFQPGASATTLVLAALAVALLHAAIVWLLFERNTARWRKALAARLFAGAPAQDAPSRRSRDAP